jgi:tetratricopeptide (TPR) repeat protein
LGTASQRLVDAKQLIADKNWPAALSALTAIIDEKSFRKLDRGFQYEVLELAGQTALFHGPPRLGYDYLLRVTAMPQATVDDWYGRLRAADITRNKADSVRSLTIVVQRWPDRVGQLNGDSVLLVVREAKEIGHAMVIPLLQALYDAHWKLKWGIEPSALWRDLALDLLERRQINQASSVAAHVTDPYVLITMRADRRFDAVVAANPPQFDIASAAERELKALQEASDRAPRSLELKWRVVRALLICQHYEGAMAAADDVLLDIQSTNFPEKLYDDFADQESTFLNYRAYALERLGRWDEAVAQMSAASLLHEKYSGNIDQILDLGELYCALRRPNEALSAIGRLVAATNAHGSMEVEIVRLEAAVQLGDSKQVDHSLAYMRAHRADAPSTYERALLIAGHLDAAAKELIRQLSDKDLRQDALLRVQVLAPWPDTPWKLEIVARRRIVAKRPDVQTVVQKVGRAESFPVGG